MKTVLSCSRCNELSQMGSETVLKCKCGGLVHGDGNSMELAQAFEVIKNAMIRNDDYAHSWHCNIAMMCHDAILEHDDQVDFAHKVGNDAASRFMKLCFDIETKG